MDFTQEVYHVAFDKALWTCDQAFEALKDGPEGDPHLLEAYRMACRKISLLTERWERQGYTQRYGSLIDNWYRRISVLN